MVEIQLTPPDRSAQHCSPTPRRPVSVNGNVIPLQAIEAEVQHHPATTPDEAIHQATEALVIRALLLQEVRRLGIVANPMADSKGRAETEDEAQIRSLIEQTVTVPQPTEAELRRYYEANRERFRSPELVEASHILIAARSADAASFDAAREKSVAVLAELQALPGSFDELARIFSDCPSAPDGGRLGQLLPGDTTPEFESALGSLEPGETTKEPVATPYGFHIIRVDRRQEGKVLPFSAVAGRIDAYLTERSGRLAQAQFVARLISAAEIAGVDVAGAAALRVTEIPKS